MDEETRIRNRITELRLAKGISEYKMSIDLGHSKSYIQSISSGRAMPSFSEFLYICEYFGITPRDFFDYDLVHPDLIQKAVNGLKELNQNDILLILGHIERLQQS